MDTRSENLRNRVEQSQLWKTDPEEAKRRFKEKIRLSKDPKEYLSIFFEDMLDKDDIEFITESKQSHDHN